MSQKFKSELIHIIFGLGNPGHEYEKTFHNAGQEYVSFLKEQYAPAVVWKKHSSGLFSYAKDKTIVYITPLVFMNESGIMVERATKFFKETPSHILVAHDDSDLPLGSYKIDFDRGAAGHKGIISIFSALGTQAFWRLRIGIRNQEKHLQKKASSFVLSKETPEETQELHRVFETIFKKEFSL